MDGSRLRNRAVSSGKLVNPGFSASVNEDGTPSTARSVGVDLSLTRKTFDGIYSVGFQEDIRNCSFAATAVRSGVTADVTRVPSNTHVVSVQLTRPFLAQGSSSIVPFREDGAFSLIVQC